jgi:hypothetical protein
LWGKTFSLITLLANISVLAMDIVIFFTKDSKSVVKDWIFTHLVVDLLDLFAWIVCTCFFFFISTRQVFRLLSQRGFENSGIAVNFKRIFGMALMFETVRVYHWILELSQIGLSILT